MDFPWEVLSFLTVFLDKEEGKSLRQVSKYWNRTITPILCQTLIYDPLETNQEAHKSFLKKYGVCADKLVFGFLGLGNVSPLSEADVAFLLEYFPKLSSIEFNICEEDPEKCAIGLRELGQGLPRLRQLELRGVIDCAILKILKPLISKLRKLSLGQIYQRDGSIADQRFNMDFLLPYLELASVKELSFFESENSESFDMLVQRFPSLDYLFYSWCCRQNNSWMLFDVQKSVIKQIWTEVGSDLEISIDFDVEHLNTKTRYYKDLQLPSKQLQCIQDFFDHDEGERTPEFILPPIKSLYMEGYAYDEKFTEFLEEKSDVPHIVLNIKHSDDVFNFPQTKFSSHCLVIKCTEGLASLLWASKWFPNLTAFYLNGPIAENDLKDHTMEFESLFCFYTCHVQPPRFWDRLLKSSKSLKHIFLSTEDPSLDQLREDYPNRSFGYWSKESQGMKEYVSFFSPSKYFFYSIDL